MATTYSLALDTYAKIKGTLTKTDGENSGTFDLAQEVLKSLSNGTGEQQANEVWADRRQLTPSASSETLDLSGGLTNFFGRTVVFTELKLIYIRNLGVLSGSDYVPTALKHLEVGGAGGAAINDLFAGSDSAKLIVKSGGDILWRATHFGFMVSAASEDELLIAAQNIGSDTIGYDIILAGDV